jgi:hypothetical protein
LNRIEKIAVKAAAFRLPKAERDAFNASFDFIKENRQEINLVMDPTFDLTVRQETFIRLRVKALHYISDNPKSHDFLSEWLEKGKIRLFLEAK